MSNRSLLTVVTDTFTAARWIHHLFKVATGVMTLVLIYALLRSEVAVPVAASILSFAWFITTKIAARLEKGSYVYELGPDLACDLALHMLPVAVLSVLWWSVPIGGVITALLVIVYFFTYPDASP